ncbi:MAG TPA: AMP-binding protein [Streptosporangiaceae bacterium]|nr:AMP-binding protein [Streptosporangiaceae bacterium]
MTMGTDAPLGEVTVTQQLLAVAPARGEHRALVGGTADPPCGYADLAATVQAAAAGLAWRGLQPRDVVGVYVPDAASYVLATHAIRAAGGVPSPVAPGLTVPEMAGQLADCGARMLLTAPPLAAAALAAADRSWVRQVISFGDAPGAIGFGALLQAGTLRPAAGRPGDPALLPYARTPEGVLAPEPVSHQDMSAMLLRLEADAGIGEKDVVLAAPPAGDGRSYTALLDHALLRGATVVASRADELATAADVHHGTAMIAAGSVAIGGHGRLRVFAVAS